METKIEICCMNGKTTVLLNNKEISGNITGVSVEILPHEPPKVTFSAIANELYINDARFAKPITTPLTPVEFDGEAIAQSVEKAIRDSGEAIRE